MTTFYLVDPIIELQYPIMCLFDISYTLDNTVIVAEQYSQL